MAWFQNNFAEMFLWLSHILLECCDAQVRDIGPSWPSCLNFYLFSSPDLCSGWAIVISFHACVRPSVNIFKQRLLRSPWANFVQISYGASLGWGNERLLKWSYKIIMVIHWHLIFLRQGQVCIPMHLYGEKKTFKTLLQNWGCLVAES